MIKTKVAIIPYSGDIPCVHEDISFMGCDEGCEIENEWELENECGQGCSDYKARQIEVCRKHHKEIVGECDDCCDDFWESLGHKLDQQQRRERWMEKHLHFTLKFSHFDDIGCWIPKKRLKIGKRFQYNMEGKCHWRGFYIYFLRKSMIFRYVPIVEEYK